MEGKTKTRRRFPKEEERAVSEQLIPGVHYSADLEYCVLAAVMIENHLMEVVRQYLQDEFFYQESNRVTWQVFRDLHDKGLKIDEVLAEHYLCRKLGDNKMPNGDAVAWYLAKIKNFIHSTAHMVDHCMALQQLYIERESFAIEHGAIKAANGKERLELIKERIERVQQMTVKPNWRHFSEVLVRMIQEIHKRSEMDMPGYPFGFETLDRLTGGGKGGEVIIVAARPSVGKTAFALKCASTQLKRGIPVGVISLEMRDISLAMRLVAQHGNIPFHFLDRGWINEMVEVAPGHFATMKEQLMRTAGAMADFPLFLDDASRVSIQDVYNKSARLIRDHGAKVLYVDYIQLVEPGDENFNSREQEVAAMSRMFKLIALRFDILVVVLAQLNRESTKRQDKKPIISDLRESGAIEQDADGVILIHRDWQVGITANEDGHSTEREADIIVAKWRNGATLQGGFKCTYWGPTMEFRED